ncbi:MAG: hypothetical protein ACLFQV_01765 [Vulcanimicrobiota bacterium]
MARNPIAWPYILNLADNREAFSIETITSKAVFREPSYPGLLVAVNHFVASHWNMEPEKNRRQLLEKKKLTGVCQPAEG